MSEKIVVDNEAVIRKLATAITESTQFENGEFSAPKDLDKIALEACGTNMESAKAVHLARDLMLTSMAQALSEKGVEVAKADSSLDRVMMNSKFIQDSASVAISRTKSYSNPKDRDGDPIVKHGVIDARYVARGANTKAGSLKATASKVSDAWASLV